MQTLRAFCGRAIGIFFTNKKSPYVTGIFLSVILFLLNYCAKMNFSNIKGINNVLLSMIIFLSIIIGFDSAFYGRIMSLNQTTLMKQIRQSKNRNALPELITAVLSSSFLCLIITILMQIFVNYKDNSIILFISYFWIFLVGVCIVYSFQIALLSIGMIFNSEPIRKEKYHP